MPEDGAEQLEGAYWYGGNGEWARIQSIEGEDDELHFTTHSISYETVPQQTRERAYDAYDGDIVILDDSGCGESTGVQKL